MIWKKIIKQLAMGLIYGSLSVLLLIALLFGLAQTNSGQQHFVKLFNLVLQDRGVKIGKLSGLIPFDFQLDHMTVSDPYGHWILAKGVQIKWSPWRLLRGRLHFEQLRAEALDIQRPPQGMASIPKAPRGPRLRNVLLPRLGVENLAVDRITFGKAFLGEQTSFTLKAKIMASVKVGIPETRFWLEQIEGGNARLRASIIWSPDAQELFFDASFLEPEAGLLARAMGLGGPLALSLQGEGRVQNWKGKLQGQVGHLAAIDGYVTVEEAKEIRVALTSSLGINRHYLPPALAAWVGKEVELVLIARPKSADRIALEQLTLKTGNVFLEFKGLLDLESTLSNIEFVLTSQDVSPLEALVKSKCAGSLAVKGTLSGTRYRPKAILDLSLSEAQFDRVRTGHSEAQLSIGLLENGGGVSPRFHIKGSGSIQELILTPSTLMHPKAIQWAATVEVSDSGPIRISRLKLDAEKMSALLAGEISIKGPSGHLDLSLELADLRLFSDALGIPLPLIAHTAIKASVKGDAREHTFTGSIQGKSKIISEAYSAMAPFFGKEASFRANVSLKKENILTISGVRLETLGTIAGGDISLDLNGKSLRSTWHLTVPQLNLLSSALNRSLRGSLDLEGTMEGPLSRISTFVELRGQNLSVQETNFERSVAHLRTIGLPPDLRGHVSLDLTQQQERFASEASFELSRGRLSFPHISVHGMATRVDGRVNLDFDRMAAEGELKGECVDLSAISPFLGGNFFGSAKVSSKFRISHESHEVILDLDGKNLRGFNAHLQDLEFHADVKGKHSVPSGVATLQIKELRLGDLNLSSAVVKGNSGNQQITFTASVRGRYREVLEMETSGKLLPFSEPQQITINRFQGRYGEIPITLIQPATLTRSPSSTSLDNILCTLDKGHFEGSGSVGANQFMMNLKFDDLPVEVLSIHGFPRFNGTATGSVALHGPPTQPEGDVFIRVNQFGLHTESLAEIPPATLEVKAFLMNNGLQSHLSLEGVTDKPIQAHLELPLTLSAVPFVSSVSPEGELKGRLDGGIDLARISLFLGLDDQRMVGSAQIGIALEGTVREPRLSGSIRANQAGYENFRSGTIIKDADIEIEASSRGLRIKHARGSDGEKGSLTAAGSVDFDFAHSFPFRLDLTLNHAKVVRHDAAIATAEGMVTFSGSLAQAILAGQVTIESAELRIPRSLPPELIRVDVIEIHGKPGGVQPAQNRKPSKDAPLMLDLSLRIPNRTFLSGRGLESEWQGELKVKGPVNAPILTGRLSVVRGRFDFLGKRFDFTKGFISFNGASPPSPILDASAEATTKDMTARIDISGLLQAPEIKLSSDPPLPQDEILSRLIFGRRLAQITPVQAVQLADAINTLAGGGGFDFMGRTRRLLGVDQLEITQIGENKDKPAVKMGKYVSETVYIEVESGITPETGKASVQWQMTPNIIVDTEVGVNASAGIGVNWKWDY